MKVTDLWNSGARPGRLVEWRLDPPSDTGAGRVRDPRPPAYIQEAHLRTARNLRERGLAAPCWVGTAFDVPGAVDPDVLGRVLHRWTLRHETLRSGFAWDGDTLRRFTLDAGAVALRRTDRGDFPDARELCRRLQDRFDAATDALGWPNFLYAAVLREDGARLYLAFDHTNVDAYSLQLMAVQVHELYAAEAGRDGGRTAAVTGTEAVSGEVPGEVRAEMSAEEGSATRQAPPYGGRDGDGDGGGEDSYAEFCGIERARADEVGTDHDTVARWREFIASCGGVLPSFPLDTGITPGELPEQGFWAETLVGDADASAFDARCRPSGGVLPGLLAACGVVTLEAGGPPAYRTVVPFHTRSASRWERSVGWYVGAVPVEIPTAGATGFDDVLGMARGALRANRALARTPVARVLRLLGADFRPVSPDLFSLLSYVDARAVPGAGSWAGWNAVTLARVSRGDQVCVWVTRTGEGLQFACRYPDTHVAHKNIGLFVEGLRGVIRSVARTGAYPG